MAAERKPSYWAIIPASVRYDPKLIPNAKLLYAEITALQEATGYCFATNQYLASLFGLKPATITTLLKNLADNGYIHVEIARDPETKEVLQRKISTTAKLPVVTDPSPIKIEEGCSINIGEPPLEKSEENNTSNSLPPKAPQGGRRRRETKEAPDHEPERFSKFWEFYPRHESKQAAIRAWDKLSPSGDLIDKMAKALKVQIKSKAWQEGIGIPYASTWLNNRRWEDEVKAAPVPQMSIVDTRGGLEAW